MDGKKLWQQGRHWLAGLMVLALAACGGSGGGSTYVPPVATPTPTPLPYISNAVVSTFAGTLEGTDGTGTAASFSDPSSGVVVAGNLYVADSNNHTIRKIVINTGEVSTFAGSAGVRDTVNGTGTAARFNYPVSITSDGSNLYIVDKYGHTIRKIVIATREVTTLAGSAGISGSSNGVGLTARFNNPEGIVQEGSNLYVADSDNHTIRKIVIATGEVSTFAGLAGTSGSTDATGSAARFDYPAGITSDGSNLYVADMANSNIRKIVIATGVVSTLAGTGSIGNSDGIGTAASFSFPHALTYDNGNLYVADSSNKTIRKIAINTAVVSTFAGTAGSKGNTDATGSAARFTYPAGIASDGTRLYVTDAESGVIRTIMINTAAVSTLAGKTYGANGIGQMARFYGPTGFATGGSNLYVTDKYNFTIRKIVINTGEVTTFAGSTTNYGNVDGVGTAANFRLPEDITSDSTNLYVADSRSNTIRKIEISTATVSTLAGSGVSGSSNGTGTAASFDTPSGIVRVGGDLYVADSYNNTIRKIVIASGVVTTFAGTAGSYGRTDGIGAAARFNYPSKICSDGSNLYVTDGGNGTIRKIVIATGAVSTIAGSSASGDADGIGIAASFSSPTGITTDGNYLYITDSSNNNIRRLTIATGQVVTIAGSSSASGNTNGIGNAARFRGPTGIISIGSALYVADTDNNIIRKITGS